MQSESSRVFRSELSGYLPMAEALERRVLLASVVQTARTLVITGDERGQIVEIIENTSALRLSLDANGNGVLTDAEDVTASYYNVETLKIEAGGGDDKLTVWSGRGGPSTRLDKVTIDLGSGDDVLEHHVSATGGSTLTGVSQSLSVLGGPGNDVVHAGGGRFSGGVGLTMALGDGDDSVTVSFSNMRASVGGDVRLGKGNDSCVVSAWSGDSQDFAGTVAIKVYGGEGRDTLGGNAETEQDNRCSGSLKLGLYGEAGNDEIWTLTSTWAGDFELSTDRTDLELVPETYTGFLGRKPDDAMSISHTISGTEEGDVIRLEECLINVKGTLVSGVSVSVSGEEQTRLVPDGRILIDAMAGDDLVTVDAAIRVPFLISGGAGNDSLTGGSAGDVLYGGDGDDRLDGGVGRDTVHANADDDSVTARLGDDLVYGGSGHDSIDSASGADTLRGGEGDDLILGGSGDDWIYGHGGHDTLVGGDGSDAIWSGPGHDRIDGRGMADTLHGGMGNDTIVSGAGADLVFGEDGDDTLYANRQSGFRDTLRGGAGTDGYEADEDDVLSEVEEVLG